MKQADRRHSKRPLLPRGRLLLEIHDCPGWPALLRITVADWQLADQLDAELGSQLAPPAPSQSEPPSPHTQPEPHR